MKTQTDIDTARVQDIIASLANGIDPLTGEVFPPDHALQHADIVGALFAASAALEVAKALAAKSARTLPPKSGQPWSPAEDHELASAFDSGMTERDLAQKHQRTRGAIRSRLVRLGKLEPGYMKGVSPPR